MWFIQTQKTSIYFFITAAITCIQHDTILHALPSFTSIKKKLHTTIHNILPSKQNYDQITHIIPYEQQQELKITMCYGEITISSWDQPNIIAHVEKLTKTNKPLETLYQHTITPKNISIAAAPCSDKEIADQAIKISLKVPRSINLCITLKKGDIKIKKMHGSIYAQTDNGSIKSYKNTGTVHATTLKGSIYAKTITIDPQSHWDYHASEDIIFTISPAISINICASSDKKPIISSIPIMLEQKTMSLDTDNWLSWQKNITGTIHKKTHESIPTVTLNTINGTIIINNLFDA
jgi:hypothetical protein